MAQPKLTDEYFTISADILRKPGGKKIAASARKAQTEAARDNEISSFSRIEHHSVPVIDKEVYDLGNDYQLVVQAIDEERASRVFLFIGSNDEVEVWLEDHQWHQWTTDKDSRLQLVRIADPEAETSVVPAIDAYSPARMLLLPLLAGVDESALLEAGLSEAAVSHAKKVSAKEWQQDAGGVRARMEECTTKKEAAFAEDLFCHANNKEWDALYRRIEVQKGFAQLVSGDGLANAIETGKNSEQFVTWEEVEALPENAPWHKWMLFLHHEQKEFATKDYPGPARLRGVSGSGKTCVMVHRARYLAKLYQEDIMLVTLTSSMRKLLEHLAENLCGAERLYIKTSTMNSLATDFLEDANELRRFQPCDQWRNEHIFRKSFDVGVDAVRSHPEFKSSFLSGLAFGDLNKFIDEEMQFVRQRFLEPEYDKYLSERRVGRQFPQFKEKVRSIILSGVQAKDSYLKSKHSLDPDGVIQRSLEIVEGSQSRELNTRRFRCVLVDEVQDLSQLEIRLLASIRSRNSTRVAEQKNGLFLVGDGAQTVYKKGFSLRPCGIDVNNRSFCLMKNYRNTKETLRAAYGLVAKYEFADVDEDNYAKPTVPDMSSRHGALPFVVRCRSERDETDFVVAKIQQLIADQQAIDQAAEFDRPTEIPIGVIGFTPIDRNRIMSALIAKWIEAKPTRKDVDWEDNAVCIDTVESMKGHEFHAVFLVGVQQGKIPNNREPEEEWRREAAKMYVAMTRARESLFISYCTAHNGRASEFVNVIQDDCQECKWEHGELRVFPFSKLGEVRTILKV